MTTNHPYDLQLLWEKTNNGLTFFEEEFSEFMSRPKKLRGFSLRGVNDKTGSCHVRKIKSGMWTFSDYGPGIKDLNAIDYVMHRDNCVFADACKTLFNQYQIPVGEFQQIKPITKFSSEVTKPLGYWKVDYFAKIQDEKTLKKIIPFYTTELLKEYDFKQIKQYENVGEKKDGNLYHRTITATDEFPIFGYDKKTFAKLYQPLAPKGDAFLLKHGFIGTKTDRIIYGWDRLFAEVDYKEIERLHDLKTKSTAKSDKEFYQDELNDLMLDNVIIATGGSDGLNIASLGYHVIWFNSEHEILSSDEYYKLSKIVKNIYYCPDLDKTGVAQAVKIGMKFLKIKMIWLPEWLKDEKKKDAADFIRKWSVLKYDLSKVQSLFRQLVNSAMHFQFWEWNKKRGVHSLNQKLLYHFLKHNGFYLNKIVLKSADSQTDIEKTRLIHIKENIVTGVSPRQVKNYVLQWCDDNFIDMKIYNKVMQSIYFSENALLSLPEIKVDTKTATADSQLYFFKNKIAKITADGIQELEYKQVDNLVWQSDIVDHNFKLQEPFFKAEKKDDAWTINILQNKSNYLKVLINTSRMYWEKDADATGVDLNRFNITSDKLTPEENAMQQLQLINKIYMVGYILHKFKVKQKAFFTLGVDNKNGASTKESNGRSGKSFIQEVLKCFLKNWKDKNGKLLHKENPQFIYDKVTSNTDYMMFDDLYEFQDFNFFFAVITGSLEANHKGGDIYDIPFEESPKLGATTNFAPLNLSASLQGRLLVYYVSDYYHQKTDDNGYPFTRQISDDFGNKTILDRSYPAEDWNNDYNFMLQCLQFYLSQNEKIDAPMEGLIIKNLRQIIGDAMLKFCNEYFADDSNLNNWVYKKGMFDYYREEIGSKAKSSQLFKEHLIHYCKTKKWSIQFQKKKIDGTGNSVEHFYINTTDAPVKNIDDVEKEIVEADAEPKEKEPSDDLPF
jgi:hypothetical protein